MPILEIENIAFTKSYRKIVKFSEILNWENIQLFSNNYYTTLYPIFYQLQWKQFNYLIVLQKKNSKSEGN